MRNTQQTRLDDFDDVSEVIHHMMGSRSGVGDIDFVLRRTFGKTAFRPYQREIITAVLEGYDVFVQAATSFGKSLCYQLPAVIDHGITVCISPLLSLMRDQITQLEASGIQVATINSTISYADRNVIMEDLRCGHPRTRLLFITPEFSLSEAFRSHLRTIYNQGELARIAIDEAHCISEWGHDFRSSYLHLSFFRKEFPTTPVICLTATATANVREDCMNILGLNPATLKIFTTTTFRPNLHYDVQFVSDHDDVRFSRFVSWYKQVQGRRSENIVRRKELEAAGKRLDGVSGIIYTTTREQCDTLAEKLRKEGIGAVAYHAGMTQSDRDESQAKWLQSEPKFEVVVATTAFGMGIDKVDVRFVVHWTLPKSFEGFYQEAGRAGRDGKASLCTIFYSRDDRDRVEYRLRQGDGKNKGSAVAKQPEKAANRLKSFEKLVEYCEGTNTCRHAFITTYFGEGSAAAKCDMACDHCKDRNDLKQRKQKGLGIGEDRYDDTRDPREVSNALYD